jgi:hypothetical protein
MKFNWLSSLLKRLRPMQYPENGAGTRPLADADTLKQMVRGIMTTRPDEVGCDECFNQVDHFAEMVLSGKDAAEAMPLVQDHLDRCGDCREEFEALLTALHALSS